MSQPNFRNRVAHALANAAFRFIADDEYEREIEAYLEYGVRSAIRDHRQDLDRPPTLEELGIPDWRRLK